jgi:hypothetical protein
LVLATDGILTFRDLRPSDLSHGDVTMISLSWRVTFSAAGGAFDRLFADSALITTTDSVSEHQN